MKFCKESVKTREKPVQKKIMKSLNTMMTTQKKVPKSVMIIMKSMTSMEKAITRKKKMSLINLMARPSRLTSAPKMKTQIKVRTMKKAQTTKRVDRKILRIHILEFGINSMEEIIERRTKQTNRVRYTIYIERDSSRRDEGELKQEEIGKVLIFTKCVFKTLKINLRKHLLNIHLELS